MKVNRYNGFKIILIGAGGTGGYIAPHLYRIAFASGCTARIIIADGDIVEEKNLIRQNFAACDIGKKQSSGYGGTLCRHVWDRNGVYTGFHRG